LSWKIFSNSITDIVVSFNPAKDNKKYSMR
jgi:hypothetical protein